MLSTLIRQARSTRRYKADDPIPRSVLEGFVDMARFVPSASNRQPLRYRIVHGAECDKLFPITRWAALLKEWKGPTPEERPTGYVAILSPSASSAPGIDIGIAAWTLQLAATEAGWRACMLGAFDAPEAAKLLNLPAEWTVRLILAFGRGGETVVLEEGMPADGRLYWRDAEGAHHVAKRTMNEVVVLPPK